MLLLSWAQDRESRVHARLANQAIDTGWKQDTQSHTHATTHLQELPNKDTQRHKDTKTQRHKDTKTQETQRHKHTHTTTHL